MEARSSGGLAGEGLETCTVAGPQDTQADRGAPLRRAGVRAWGNLRRAMGLGDSLRARRSEPIAAKDGAPAGISDAKEPAEPSDASAEDVPQDQSGLGTLYVSGLHEAYLRAVELRLLD